MAHRSEIMMDITSANLTVTFQAEGVMPEAVTLQNFSTDQSLIASDMAVADGRVGMDGGFAVGFIPSANDITITLEANSPSQIYMFHLAEAMRANRCTYNCILTCSVPSMKTKYIWCQGTLVECSVLPNPKKLLEPTNWKFRFVSIRSEPITELSEQ